MITKQSYVMTHNTIHRLRHDLRHYFRHRLGYVLAAVAVVLLAACSEKKQPVEAVRVVEQDDSLKQVIAERESQINNMMATMNEIQEGFNAITDAENRVNMLREDERADKTLQIKESVKVIADRMQLNRELIKKLRRQLRESDFKSAEMKRVITNMLKQLETKDEQLQQLQAELDAKDIHIMELDETIIDLHGNVSDLEAESAQKTQTINSQEMQLNTAWYVYGTKNELKDQNILVGGKVLQQNFNRSYFKKIDIRVTKEIKFYSKSVKLLTTHPSSSYELKTDNNKQYELVITNPQIFWSTSKYLVVLVK